MDDWMMMHWSMKIVEWMRVIVVMGVLMMALMWREFKTDREMEKREKR